MPSPARQEARRPASSTPGKVRSLRCCAAERHASRAPPAVCWDSRSGTGKFRANYSTAPQEGEEEAAANTSASRANSVSCSASGRSVASTPAAAMARRGSTARSSAKDLTAFRRVLRRWVKIVRTIRSNMASSFSVHDWIAELEPEHRRMDLRDRPECPGRQGQQPAHGGAKLDEDRQRSVVLRAGRSLDAVGHFALDHQRRVNQPAAVTARPQELEDDWRGHVVGQVAGHPEVAAGGREQVEVEEILLDERDVRRQTRPQGLGHVTVQFNGSQVGDERREPERERAGARPNLEKAIRRREQPLPATSRSAQAGSRKCCPNRFFACRPETRPLASRRITRRPAIHRASTFLRFPQSRLRSCRSGDRIRG